MSTKRSPFDIACSALCCKADIPEVEAVRKLLFHPLKGALQGITMEVLRRVNARLDELETTVGAPDVNLLAQADPAAREETLRQLMASILVAFASGETAFLPVGVENLIRDAAGGLLDMGADEIDAPRDYPQRALVQAGLVSELRIMILYLLTARRTDVEQAISHFLTSSDPRTERSQIVLSGLPESELPRSREEFNELLALSLLVPGTPEGVALVDHRIDTALDIWAYSAFVAAEVEAGLATVPPQVNPEGRLRVVALALIDAGTTKFCRWVNKREIPLSRVQKELAGRRDAVTRGDGKALMNSRRFLTPNQARNGSTALFAKFFRTAGLPQYHIGCRTIVGIKRGR